jgi:hypothetical protein
MCEEMSCSKWAYLWFNIRQTAEDHFEAEKKCRRVADVYGPSLAGLGFTFAGARTFHDMSRSLHGGGGVKGKFVTRFPWFMPAAPFMSVVCFGLVGCIKYYDWDTRGVNHRTYGIEAKLMAEKVKEEMDTPTRKKSSYNDYQMKEEQLRNRFFRT